MKTLTIDPQKAISVMEAKGYSRDQIEGFVEVVREIDLSELVSKADLEVALAKQTASLYRFFTGAFIAQAGVIVALIALLG